jgi:hypothetical protein
VTPRYAPPVRRRDRGRTHWYEDANGTRVPGVTTILSNGLPKPALINWAGNVTAEYAVDHWDELAGKSPSVKLAELKKARYADRDAAANRGTQVHGLAEQLIRGVEVPVPEELAGHVEAYVRFLDEWNPTPLLVEAVVVSHKHGYAGTLDLVAEVGGRVWLLDVKTGRSGVFGEVAAQLAGYRYADVYVDGSGVEVPMPVVDRCGVIHVRSDGYSLLPVDAGPAQFRYLLYAQQVAEFCDVNRSFIGEALVPELEGS